MSATTGISGLFGVGLAYGGPGSLVWGWLLASVFTFLTALSMSEICSSLPTAGGIYYWSYMLSGRHGPFAAWLTAHANFVGQVACLATKEFLCLQLVTTWMSLAHLVIFQRPHIFPPGQQVAMYAGLLIVHGVINAAPVRFLGWLAKVSCVWHIGGTLAWIATMLIVTPYKQPIWGVLTTFQPNPRSGISNRFYLFLLGLLTASWSQSGVDATAHLLEETVHADDAASRSMLTSAGACCITGFGYVLTLCLCIRDYGSVWDPGNATGGQYPAAQVMFDAFMARFGSGAGSLLVLAVPVGTSFLSSLFSVAGAARTLYGAARDGSIGVLQPYAVVSPYTRAPVTSVCLVCGLAFLPALSILASPYIFLAVTSMATICLTFSYAAPIFCRIALARSRFQPGRFNLKRWSLPCGMISVGWSIFMCIIFSLPPIYPITLTSFNFSPWILLLVFVWVGATWGLWARHWYKGPAPHICNSDAVKVQPYAWT